MYNKDLVIQIFQQIQFSIEKIIKRFEPIKSSDDFLINDTYMEKLDAICMQLNAIGESLKKLIQ